MIFGLNGEKTQASLGEVARMIGRTRARAGQLKDEALEDLREMMRKDGTYREFGD